MMFRSTLVCLALEKHVIAEGAGARALAAGRRVAGRSECAVVSGGNLDAGVLAGLLSAVRPRAPRRPRRRARESPSDGAIRFAPLPFLALPRPHTATRPPPPTPASLAHSPASTHHPPPPVSRPPPPPPPTNTTTAPH